MIHCSLYPYSWDLVIVFPSCLFVSYDANRQQQCIRWARMGSFALHLIA